VKGTIMDFLKLAAEKPELAKDLVALAQKYGFEFSDEVSDEELDGVTGGATVKVIMQSLTGGGLPDGMGGPPGSGGTPTPYPNPSGGLPDGPVKSSSSWGADFEVTGGNPPDQSDPGIGSA